MWVNFVFLLFSAGALSLFAPQKRFSFLWQGCLLAVLGFGIFSINGYFNSSDFSAVWKALPNLNVTIKINPLQWRSEAFGILSLAVLSVYYTILSAREQQKNIFGGLVLLNCVFTFMAFSSSNYIQLIAAVGVADVVVYMSINEIGAKKQYIYGNFLADFMLLNILAAVIGQQGSITIGEVDTYSKHWHHRDFIAIMLLVCIFVKMGIVFFHTAYQKMSGLFFNRLNFILFSATPLMGIVILHLLKDILVMSDYSYPLLKVMSVLTILWSSFGAVTVNNLRRCGIYMAMFFWGLVLAAFSWLSYFSEQMFFIFMISAFLFNNVLMLAVKAASDEVLISHMGGFAKKIKITLAVSFLSVLLYASAWWLLVQQVLWLAVGGLCMFTFASAHILAEIYLSPSHADEIVVARLKNPVFMLFLPIVGIAIALASEHQDKWPYIVGYAMLWWAVFISHPLHKLSSFYASEQIQKNDFVTLLYSVLIFVPLQILGRILRLTIDFVFVERTVIASVKSAVHFLIFVFRRLHSNSYLGYVFFILIGVMIVVAAYFNGVAK